jgi:hypothetical protein
MVFVKGPLQRVEALALGQTLHSHKLSVIRLHRQQQAGAHGFAVKENGTGTADAMFATQVRACEMKLLAQEIGQSLACFHHSFVSLPIDPQLDAALSCHRSSRPLG